jgi:hypothetical protein
MDLPQISALAGIAALRACGHPGRSADAPAPIAGYALAFSAAVTGLAVAAQASGGTDWTGAPSEQIAQALYSIARDGLIPGGISDPGATAYIFKGKGSPAPTGRPSPRGRLAMARAAGCDVRTLAVGKADSLTLNDSGDVDHLELDPDARPASWGDLRGVVLHVDDLHTGARRSLWIARADLAERKSKAGAKSAWDTDAIGMALTKAVAIAIGRGAIPQASLIPAILAACAAHPAPARPLAIEAPARQIAEALPQPAPPTQPDPEPTPEPTDAPAPDGPIEVRLDACAATDPEPDAEPGPTIADDIVGDLAADAECSRDHAEQAIDVAVEALRAAGKPHHIGALRAPPVWGRLIQRASQAARAAEAEATEA